MGAAIFYVSFLCCSPGLLKLLQEQGSKEQGGMEKPLGHTDGAGLCFSSPTGLRVRNKIQGQGCSDTVSAAGEDEPASF